MAALERVRALGRAAGAKHMYEAAAFWADKAVSLSGSDKADVFALADAWYRTGQFARARRPSTGKR